MRTLTAPQAATRVQLLVDGQRVSGVFPGIDTSDAGQLPLPEHAERARARAAAAEAPAARQARQGRPAAADRARLPGEGRRRRPLRPGRRSNALLAFQKWERLPRTGLLDSADGLAPGDRGPPAPLSQGRSGRRAEILLDRQVALLIEDNEVVRTIAVSTGKPSTPTPPGDYRVYAKIPRWWSTPFREWLPLALPFVGGIAFHQFLDVPAYAASHGCVRQSPTVARWTYDFASVGMPVKVIARS